MHDGDVPIYRILDLDLLSKACSQHANYGWGCKIYEREHLPIILGHCWKTISTDQRHQQSNKAIPSLWYLIMCL